MQTGQFFLDGKPRSLCQRFPVTATWDACSGILQAEREGHDDEPHTLTSDPRAQGIHEGYGESVYHYLS
jgi:hypothetical protein